MLSNILAAAALCPLATDPVALTTVQARGIDHYVKAEMTRQQIPGLTLGIFRRGHAVLLKGYGLANVEHGVPSTPDTIMQSGSVGKTFTATLVLMLVEQGKVQLNDSIRSHLTTLPDEWQPITIAHLLSHTSGLTDYDGSELTGPGRPFDIRRDFSEAELVRKVAEMPLEFAPGERWSYRNSNYLVLGALVRHITGAFYGDMLKREIFDKLGMTSSRVISDREIVPNRAAGYERHGGKLYNQQWVSPTFNSTADGTLYLTVRDLELWDRALCGASLLKPSTLQQMWTPFAVGGTVPTEGYGFGWFVRRHESEWIVEHDGAWQGFTSYLGRYVGAGITVAVLTNLDSGHSRPDIIGKVVVGLVDPSLMPPSARPVADDRPDLSQALWSRFEATMNGEAIPGSYQPTQETIADLRTMLPPDWNKAAPSLISRHAEGEEWVSTYKIGPKENSRILVAVSDAGGNAKDFDVSADPDNR